LPVATAAISVLSGCSFVPAAVSSPVADTNTPHVSATAVALFVGSQTTGEPLEVLEDEVLVVPLDELLDVELPVVEALLQPTTRLTQIVLKALLASASWVAFIKRRSFPCALTACRRPGWTAW
jgi:hypothetical protein